MPILENLFCRLPIFICIYVDQFMILDEESDLQGMKVVKDLQEAAADYERVSSFSRLGTYTNVRRCSKLIDSTCNGFERKMYSRQH
jgi:hypothetical protein